MKTGLSQWCCYRGITAKFKNLQNSLDLPRSAMFMDLYSLAVVLIEIAEWRPLKHIIKKYVDVTKPGVDVSLEDLSGIQSWLVKEQVLNGHVDFRMEDVYGEGISSFLMQRIYHDPEQEEQEEEDPGDLLAFHQFIVELSKCRV